VPAVSAPAAIDARLIELPGDESPMSGGASAASSQNPSSSPASTKAAGTPRVAARKNNATRETRLLAKPPHPSKQQHKPFSLPAAHYAAEDPANESPPASVLAPSNASDEQLVSQKRPLGTAAANTASASYVSTAGRNLGTGIGNGVDVGSGAGNGSGARGGSGARAIYAPVPSIPDDMRDEVMQATAVAHFHVAPDGSATVALTTPTDFAALDQLILDTLSHWRFQPAVRDGVAIESDAEVRLRITVQ
jgi:hypothetical protein